MYKAGSAVLLAMAGLLAADTVQTEAWEAVAKAVRAGGQDAASALEMLGAIGDSSSRALLETTLKSKDGGAIGDVAAGLTAEQCASYLTDLGIAAQDPDVVPKFGILNAIARAGNVEAAHILVGIADRAGLPTAGAAFGLLGRMGTTAEPLLIDMVTSGHSAWSRETATAVLRRMKVSGALGAFRSALHDSDGGVRIVGALGLAEFGSREGIEQIEAAAASPAGGYQVNALVCLAVLGQSEAFDSLKGILTGPDEAVRGQVVWAMAWFGNARVKEFAYGLGLDRRPAYRNMLADRLLDPDDPRDMSVLQEMITAGDDMSQLIAAHRLLGTKASDRARFVVERALSSDSDAVRHLALKVVSEYPALRPALANQLASPDPEVQIAALSAITDLHQKDRLNEVAPYLASKVRAVSAAAARTLVALDLNAARDILEQGLNSKSNFVRIHSAAMLLAIAARSQAK